MFSKSTRAVPLTKETRKRFRVKGVKTEVSPPPPILPPPPSPTPSLSPSPPRDDASDASILHVALRAAQDEHDRELSQMLEDLRKAHNTLRANQEELREVRARAALWQTEATVARSAVAAAVARHRLEVAALQQILDER